MPLFPFFRHKQGLVHLFKNCLSLIISSLVKGLSNLRSFLYIKGELGGCFFENVTSPKKFNSVLYCTFSLLPSKGELQNNFGFPKRSGN